MAEKSDPDGMNEARTGWARAAVEEFQRQTGSEDDTALYDLLCDLMHFADATDQDFDANLERARDHYLAETGQPGPISDQSVCKEDAN